MLRCYGCYVYCVFFFKQKTAYEMRISDWSSDVCSSDLVLRFTDNLLTGSDSDADDLWIFEVGPDVEGTVIDISTNGVDWLSVGSIGGSTRGVDIDAFGFGAGSAFSYVRLTDIPGNGGTSGATVGADNTAGGAICTPSPPTGTKPHRK